MKAENSDNRDCPQRDSAEHEGYAEVRRSFRSIWKEKDSAQPELLEKILYKDNLNRAYKRVKASKGAPGIDGITVDEIGAYLRDNQETIIERIYKEIYTRPGKAQRNPKSRRWNAKAWYSNSQRPYFSASHSTTTDADL